MSHLSFLHIVFLLILRNLDPLFETSMKGRMNNPDSYKHEGFITYNFIIDILD